MLLDGVPSLVELRLLRKQVAAAKICTAVFALPPFTSFHRCSARNPISPNCRQSPPDRWLLAKRLLFRAERQAICRADWSWDHAWRRGTWKPNALVEA